MSNRLRTMNRIFERIAKEPPSSSPPDRGAHEVETLSSCVPLLKWPGGKRTLAKSVAKHFPETWNTYFEPFFGGGALFFSLAPKAAVIADTNEELVNCYRIVRDHPRELIRVLRKFKNTEEAYYEARASKPRVDIRRAARFCTSPDCPLTEYIESILLGNSMSPMERRLTCLALMKVQFGWLARP